MHGAKQFSESQMNQIWSANLASDFSGGTYILPVTSSISKYLVAQKCKGTLLDIGCSNGGITSIFDRFGFNCIGIDGDAGRIAKAKLAYPHIDFKCFTFKDKLPFEDNSFDVIFSSSVFQYLEHDTMLRESKRVLRKGGSIILIENLKNNPVTRLGRSYLKLTKHQYHSYPWNHFTLHELVTTKKQFNDSKVEVFHLFSPVAYLKILRRLAPLLIGLDQKLLKVRFLRNFAWLGLLMGKNK